MWQEHHGQGLRLYERGLHEAARQIWRTAYAEASRAGETEGVVRCLSGLAGASLLAGDLFGGYQHAALAEHVAQSLGVQHELALNAAVNMQMSLSLLGLFGEARRHAETWLPHFQAAGGARLGEFVHLAATLALESGDPQEALDLANAALELTPDSAYSRVVVGQTLAMAEVATGDSERGGQLLRECHAAFGEIGDSGDRMLCATEVARLEVGRRRFQEAGVWLDRAVGHLLRAPAALDGLELGRLLCIGGQVARAAGEGVFGAQLLDQGALVLSAHGRSAEAEDALRSEREPIALDAALAGDVPESLGSLGRLLELGVARRALFCLQPLSPVGSAAHLLAAELHPGVDVAAVETALVLGPFDRRSESIVRSEGSLPDSVAAEGKVFAVLRAYARGVAESPYAQVLQWMQDAAGASLDRDVVRRLQALHVA